MKTNPTCRVCGVVLNEENWYASSRKSNSRICKKCHREWQCLWRKRNPDKAKARSRKGNRKAGHRPFNENKECASYLGIHIAERVLSHVFKDVKRMPYGHLGYDIICNRNKLIDIKSACQQTDKRWGLVNWQFSIRKNKIADYFLCLAFDNREDLTPLHAWLLPGEKFNHLTGVSISLGTIHKWDAYRLDLSKISDCCNTLR